jgi:hypothetical protein
LLTAAAVARMSELVLQCDLLAPWPFQSASVSRVELVSGARGASNRIKIKVASEAALRFDERKVSFAMDDSTENTPLKGGDSRPTPGIKDHLHAVCKYFFILLDRKWGFFGFLALTFALTIITATAVYVNFFSGCAAMVVCFACVFCYGTSHAADGQYKNAAPFCLAGLLIIGGGVLCAQFFIKYHTGYNGHDLYGPNNAGYPLAYFSQHPVDVSGNYVHLSEGVAKTDMIGSFEECLHKLPIVGSCINRFYCVVPFVAPTWKATDVVTLWAGSYLATDCSTPQFVHSADYLEWITGVKRGIGFAPSGSWKHAINDAVVKHGLKTLPVLDSVASTPQAQVLHIVADPFADKNHNWSMVRFFVFVRCASRR